MLRSSIAGPTLDDGTRAVSCPSCTSVCPLPFSASLPLVFASISPLASPDAALDHSHCFVLPPLPRRSDPLALAQVVVSASQILTLLTTPFHPVVTILFPSIPPTTVPLFSSPFPFKQIPQENHHNLYRLLSSSGSQKYSTTSSTLTRPFTRKSSGSPKPSSVQHTLASQTCDLLSKLLQTHTHTPLPFKNP